MADAGALQGHLLTPQGWLRGELRHRGGRIVAIEGVGTTAAEVRGSSLPILLPGFIDLHVHGGGGHDTMGGGDAALQMARTHARHGTTSLLATTMTAPRDQNVNTLTLSATVRSDVADPDSANNTAGRQLQITGRR